MTTPSRNPVQSELPQDLKFNSGKIDEFVNSIINQYIDRFGVAHLTIAGITALARSVIEQIKADGAEAVAAIGWQELGDWAINLSITNRDQVVWYDNAWYKFIGELPHTITGDSPETDGGIWSESTPDGLWVNIGDAALRNDLASSIGSGLVGLKQGGKIQDAIAYVTPEMFGAVGNGIADDTLSVQAAFNSGVRHIKFLGGSRYKITSTVTHAGEVHVDATNAVIICDWESIIITDGHNSTWDGGTLETLTIPYNIKRNPITWTATSSEVTQQFDGYQPTGNDTDIISSLPPNIVNQRICNTLKFTSSSSAPVYNIKVSNVIGKIASIIFEGCQNSSATCCRIKGGKQYGCITFWNNTNIKSYGGNRTETQGYTFSKGKGNHIGDCDTYESSWCGVFFVGNEKWSAESSSSYRNGESGFKIMQKDTYFPLSVICTEGSVTDSFSWDNYYDGYDLALTFPETGSQVGNNAIINCVATGNRATGAWSDGRYTRIIGGYYAKNGNSGVKLASYFCDMDSVIAHENVQHQEMWGALAYDLFMNYNGCRMTNCSVSRDTPPPNTYAIWHRDNNVTSVRSGENINNSAAYPIFVHPSINFSGYKRNKSTDTESVIFGGGSAASPLAGMVVEKYVASESFCSVLFKNGELPVNFRGGRFSPATDVAMFGFASNLGRKATGDWYQDSSSYGSSWLSLGENTINLYGMQAGETAPFEILRVNRNEISPGHDNIQSLGSPSRRVTNIYAAAGFISTSDEDEKTFRADNLSADAERAAAIEIKSAIRAFQFNDSIEKKGVVGARWHFGVGAQNVGDILRSHGLDPANYAFFCYDEWPETPAETDDTGNELTPAIPAGHRYGIRYEQLAMFILFAM
ncbi:hypothetical protein [Serratia fonticola]|uniref:tail fiber domain-containing protein n=1 Tax=Serratia fonticola TaxID=47917 RepID=UPI003AAFAF2C